MSVLAFVVALQLRQWLGHADADLGPLSSLDNYGLVLLGMAPLWGVSLVVTRAGRFRDGMGPAVLRYARTVGLGLLLLIGANFVLHLHFISRSFVLMFAATQLVMLIGGHAALLALVRWRGRELDHRVLVVGCDEEAVRFASSLRNGAWSQHLVGFVGMPGHARMAAASPVVGELEALAAVLDREPVDEVVFTGSDRSGPVHEAIDACQVRGVDVMLAMPAVVPGRGRVEMTQMSSVGLPMLSISQTPSAQGQHAAKRGFDLLMAAVLVVLASPVMLLTALAIAVESRGPVLFRQVRAGRNGRQFSMLKFRSMVVDAEAQRAALAHLNEMDGPVFKIRRDPRVTRVGAFIRATSIDELPQLLNVLWGHMSLVGPRPPLPSEVEQYKPWQRRRLSVRPGITGLWQVSGRNDVDFEQWMKLDLRYIDNWSMGLDLQILMRTLPAVVSRTGS